MSDDKRGDKDWMQTQTRRQVWPLALRHQDVDLRDIAASLGKQCRYNGHVDKFYSVAEHAVTISKALERDGFDRMTQFVGLHHDDNETYSGDIIRPLKNALRSAGVDIKPWELANEQVISERFGMPWPWPDIVNQYDTAIIADEKAQLKSGGPFSDWTAFGVPKEGLNVVLPCWDWERATHEYLERHEYLAKQLGMIVAHY
jgi:hypothetical protein